MSAETLNRLSSNVYLYGLSQVASHGGTLKSDFQTNSRHFTEGSRASIFSSYRGLRSAMMSNMGISPQGAEHLTMKIGRAYKHVMEFDSLVVAHCRRTDLFTATGREENGRLIVRVEFAKQDGDIALSLGDFVYNLRSGLDQLAWQLCLAGGGNPGRDSMFPIYERDDAKSEELFLKRVKGMHPDAVAIIRQLQPYKRGADFRKHPLWQLNELGNIDKHRLPAGRSTDTSFYIEPLGFRKTDFDNGMELSWPLSAKDKVKMEGKTPTLTFGEPIDAPSSRHPLELTREDIAEIYRYVREDVAPQFTRFLT